MNGILLALHLLMAAEPSSAPEASASAAAIIQRALSAHGGADRLRAPQPRTLRAKVSMDVRGAQLECAAILHVSGEQLRSEITLPIRGTLVDSIETWDGQSAWRTMRGPASEMPADPARSAAAHRPEAVLLRLAAAADKAREVGPGGGAGASGSTGMHTMLELADPAGRPELVAFASESGRLAWVEYDWPENDGMGVSKIRRRRDAWSDWRPLPNGELAAWIVQTDLDGTRSVRMSAESIQQVAQFPEGTFSLEEPDERPRASDEMAE